MDISDKALLTGQGFPHILGADDFIEIFDNIVDFEKEIGIDGDVNSGNLQTIGTEEEQTDTLEYHKEDNVISKSLDSTSYQTRSLSTIAALAQQNLTCSSNCTYWQHSRTTVSSAPLSTENEIPRLSHDVLRTKFSGYVIGRMKTKTLSKVSKTDTAQMRQALDIDSYRRVFDDRIYLTQQKRKRQQKMQDLINQRRRQFQKQKRMDDEQVPHQLLQIEEQARVDKMQRATEQASKRQKDGPFAAGLGLALSNAVSAAESIGVPQLDNGKSYSRTLSPSPQLQTQTQQDRHHTHHGTAYTTVDNLDPEDPDPWNEEIQHYLLIGRIKRMEDLQAKREAELTGEEYKPAVYNPTGLQRREFDPLLSRNGTGLSAIGAALDAISTNTRIRPSGNQGSSLVLQDQHDAHMYAQSLDLQPLSTRQKISRTLGLTSNNNKIILDTGANSGSGKSKVVDSLPSDPPSLTCHDKTSKLLVSNLCNNVTESTLKSLAAKGLKSLYFNQSDHSAILYFLSTDAAVMFRRMYNKSLVGGQRIVVHFMKN